MYTCIDDYLITLDWMEKMHASKILIKILKTRVCIFYALASYIIGLRVKKYMYTFGGQTYLCTVTLHYVMYIIKAFI